MDSTDSKIHFCHPDKLKHSFIPYKYLVNASDYHVSQVRFPSANNSEFTLIETFAEGSNVGNDLDDHVKLLQSLSHPSLYHLNYYSYALNVTKKHQKLWKIWFIYEPSRSNLEEYIANKRKSQTNSDGVVKGSRFSEKTVSTFVESMISLFC